MATGLPARSEIPESEKAKVVAQIAASRAMINYLKSRPEKELDPPTLLNQERTMNDLKPLARYLSPILIAVSILIVIFIFVHVPDAADYPFIAIMLALVAIWLQGVTKT